ncbi:hypothetical protein L6452_30165 [Arctium lappa]|uniref:Uncharacterized protein n=1 Tax=Arctium lappa TaxID=4217 RepID=A0ACB8ZIV3_ARCLA|nr:hypothetical protein L6452_30165 [Arctium lappa]
MSNFSRQIRFSSSVIRGLQYRISRSFTTLEGHRPTIVLKQGLNILHDPWFNKNLFTQKTWGTLGITVTCRLRCQTNLTNKLATVINGYGLCLVNK